MNRAWVTGLVSVLMLFAASCSTLEVSSNFNPKTDFSRLKTYAWLNDVDHPSSNVRVNNELVRNSVREGIEEDLAAKGFIKSEQRDTADFLVTWFGAIEQKLKVENINNFYAPYGYGTLYRDPYWNSNPTVTKTKAYEEGSLIIDFLDPKHQALLWRGTGKDRIEAGQPPETVKRKLKESVRMILANFPPN